MGETMPTLEELAAQVAALTAALAEAQKPTLPDVDPAWGRRTCQICAAVATVIDVSPETRAHVRNGEGYCMAHATSEGVLEREHLTR